MTAMIHGISIPITPMHNSNANKPYLWLHFTILRLIVMCYCVVNDLTGSWNFIFVCPTKNQFILIKILTCNWHTIIV
jgi:hypothetical protein